MHVEYIQRYAEPGSLSYSNYTVVILTKRLYTHTLSPSLLPPSFLTHFLVMLVRVFWFELAGVGLGYFMTNMMSLPVLVRGHVT